MRIQWTIFSERDNHKKVEFSDTLARVSKNVYELSQCARESLRIHHILNLPFYRRTRDVSNFGHLGRQGPNDLLVR